jgi:hypothetical protein
MFYKWLSVAQISPALGARSNVKYQAIWCQHSSGVSTCLLPTSHSRLTAAKARDMISINH